MERTDRIKRSNYSCSLISKSSNNLLPLIKYNRDFKKKTVKSTLILKKYRKSPEKLVWIRKIQGMYFNDSNQVSDNSRSYREIKPRKHSNSKSNTYKESIISQINPHCYIDNTDLSKNQEKYESVLKKIIQKKLKIKIF